MRDIKFEIYSRNSIFKGKQYFFRIKAGNGEVIAQSEGYKNKKDCISTVALIRTKSETSSVEYV